MSPADSPFAQLPAPGPHPATAELRAYAAGTLAPADEHRIEAHTLDCERCADLVEGFSMSDAAATDQAVAELRTRLQARLGTAEPEPVAAPWAWPRIAAAAAILGVVGGGIWGWEQHDSTTAPVIARLETAAPTAPTQPLPAPGTPPAAPEAAAEIATAPAPKATEVTKEAEAGNADYAAVVPSRSRQRATGRGLERPTSRPAKPVVVADADMANADSIVSPEQVAGSNEATPSQPARSAGLTSATVAAAPAKSEAELAARTSADTVADDSNAKKARRFAKAKEGRAASAPDQAATAIVPATPMPAAPAISPSPVGGTPALRDYLRREATDFEPEINNLRLTGTVRVRFVVGADGKVSNLKVVRGLRADYDAEALRIVCEGPAWQPGIYGGRRAALPMEVTVSF
ncbi:energy transducer TonB [Hymenobacter terricola]|uniref:energy transducer TonB n=1 Tax=Hymenobacter terricola TaxID=2819236 RepID=UPI001B30E759|nr:energy transducer TonB [Hymenobacter terricola]